MWDYDAPDFWIKVIVITILIFLVFFALYWEYQDYQRIFNMPDIDEVAPDQREAYLQWIACYNYNNNPQWREVYLATIIIALVLLFAFGSSVPFRIGILILLIIFIIFYGILPLNSYHVQRLLCNKANPPFTVL